MYKIDSAAVQSRPENQEYGKNILVRSRYFRHAQKASGAVGEGATISTSSISEKGRVESVELGSQLERPALDGYKIAWSGNPRTLETGKAVAEGYLGDEKRKEFNANEKKLLGNYTEDYAKWTEIYIAKWEKNKTDLMNSRGIDPLKYKELTPDEQMEIAEAAEEPVISEWLENSDGELAQAFSPEQTAAQVAVQVRRDIRMPEKLKSGSEIDLFRITHKTITEPLLMKILVLENGQKPDKLSDIGGSLSLNDGFEFESSTDEKGKPKVKFIMYRTDRLGEQPVYNKHEYAVDLAELNRLADLGINLDKPKA